jgi:chemotaxis protein CheC
MVLTEQQTTPYRAHQYRLREGWRSFVRTHRTSCPARAAKRCAAFDQRIGCELSRFLPGEIAWVHQVFEDPLAGDALLLLNSEGAVELTELLTDNSNGSHRLDESAREVLTEVGNILLNACLGVFGNVLHVQVGFSVPRLRLDNVDQLVQWLNSGGDELRYALVIFTKFQVRYSQVNGYLVLVLNMTAFDRLETKLIIGSKRKASLIR